MSRSGPVFWPLHLSLGLLSLALIAFQLVLMQILSITQWYHFAYMVISIALLGFGASGTLIALARFWLLARFEVLVPLAMFASAAAMAAVVSVGQGLLGGYDSYLLFFDPAQAGKLLLINLLITVPFFFGALAIGLILVRHIERIGSLYFANLLGSGLGGMVAIVLLGLVDPERLPALVALFALAAALLVARRKQRAHRLAALVTPPVILCFLLFPAAQELSQYKDLQGALNLPGARIVARGNSPYGQVHLVSGAALRHAPGLSLAYPGQLPAQDVVFSNGNWFGAVPPSPAEAESSPLDFTTSALPYALKRPGRVLVLHAGTGEEAQRALARGADRVVAVEPHRAVLDLLDEQYPGRLAGDWAGRLERVALEPRTWLATDANQYDLIVLPAVGTFGGSVGLGALQEEHLFTAEALAEIWGHLESDGLISATVWLDYPARNPLRLAATLAEMLENQGVREPRAHIAAVRSWGTLTFCVKRTPFSREETAQVRQFCRRMLFDPALLPGLRPEERQGFNLLQDPRLLEDLERLFGPGRKDLYRDYPFRLDPVRDDRPFFSQFLRWRSLPLLSQLFGSRAVPFLEMGYLIVFFTLFQAALAALVLILLPLLRLGWGRGNRLATLLYFGSLGLGYMLVEMVLIHRFVLYLGAPVYAAAAVVTAVLVFSGAGSYCSSRFENSLGAPRRAAALVAMLILAYSLLLPPVLKGSIALPLAWKFFFTLLLLAPLSFAMGFPFPLGLGHLARRSEPDVPWAWGINGCLSVVSTALATIIAVEAGFTAVLLVAGGAYATAAASGGKR